MRPIIKEGSIVLSTRGCYSDYWTDGAFIALKEINPEFWLTEFEKENPMSKPKYEWVKLEKCWDDPKFAEFLVDKGLLKKIEYYELHMGDYDYAMTPDKINVYEKD